MAIIEGAQLRGGIERSPTSRIFHVSAGPSALQAAIDAATANNGDLIVLSPGSHTVTTSVLFNKQGITIVSAENGIAQPARGEKSTITADAAFTDGPVGIISQFCRIVGLGFAGRSLTEESLLIDHVTPGGFNGAYSQVEDCRFQTWFGAIDAGIRVKVGDYNHIVGCTFDGGTVGYGTAAIVVEGTGADAVSRLRVLRNYFSGVGSGKHAIAHAGTGSPRGVVYAHNYMERGQSPAGGSDLLGKFLDNGNLDSSGLVADNWLGGMANKAGAFENLTNSNLKFSDNHYEEA